MLGFFVVSLDAQIVNLALPEIGRDLGGGLSGLQWVVTGYTLAFSALLLFAGTLSDRIGARRSYGFGLLVFVLASAACGFAPGLGLLIGARVAQGVGAALITPTALALIREAYHEADARSRAIAYWALGGSVAAAAGPVLGGLLTGLDWRLIFHINLPVGLLGLFLLTRVAPSEQRAHPFDPVGQVCAILALTGLTFTIIEGAELGYTSPPIISSALLLLIGFAGFALAQARGTHPMVAPEVFRSRSVAIALVVGFVGMAGFYGVVFVQSLYFQQQRGASPLQTGLLFLPMTALVAILNPAAARLARRYGPHVPIIGGQLLMAAGLAGLAAAPADLPVWAVAALMVPVGVGGAATVPPLTSLILDAVPAAQAGTASGVLNTARQVGGSLGVAVIGAVIGSASTFLAGLRISLSAVAVMVAAAAVLSLALRTKPRNRPTTEGASA
nr:MFS transporter [Kineosporia babensis]